MEGTDQKISMGGLKDANPVDVAKEGTSFLNSHTSPIPCDPLLSVTPSRSALPHNTPDPPQGLKWYTSSKGPPKTHSPHEPFCPSKHTLK